jgi:hypothetical protein
MADQVKYRGVVFSTRKFTAKAHKRQVNTSIDHSLRELDITLLATAKHPIYWAGALLADLHSCVDAYANNPRVAIEDAKKLVDDLLGPA